MGNILVCSLLRLDFYLEVQQLVFAFRKVYACSFLEVELGDVCMLRSRVTNKLHIEVEKNQRMCCHLFAIATRQRSA